MYSEMIDFNLTFSNPSSSDVISNVYIITSHPIFFGFTHKNLDLDLVPGQTNH